MKLLIALIVLGAILGGIRGECECEKNYVPVCGRDGITYPNACEMECVGVKLENEGECGLHCDCGDEYEPVCGYDDVTYFNKCEADCVAMGIKHEGECET